MKQNNSRSLTDLKSLGVDRLLTSCSRCGNTGNFSVDHLIEEHGATASVWALLQTLHNQCPRTGNRPFSPCEMSLRE
jgi:5-methylcytosine-specific restriction endonuclease McrA